jgi:hypothetical protein
MISLSDIDKSKILRLLLTVLLLFILGKAFMDKFGSFLFFTPYDVFKEWYPRYHAAAYTFIQALKVLMVALTLFFVWRYKSYLTELRDFLKAVYGFSMLMKNKIASGSTAEIPSNAQAVKRFWSMQVLLLLMAVAGYYFIQTQIGGERGFQIQLWLSIGYLYAAISLGLLFVLNHTPFCIYHVTDFLFKPLSPYNIAVYRIIFFIILGFAYAGYAFYNIIYVESKPRETLPFIGWLIAIIPITKELYFWACIAGIVSCLFLVLGLFSRYFLVINAVIIFYVVSVPNFYGKIWHSHLPIWISWILLFAPVSDVLSLDRLLFRKNIAITKSPSYNFPVKMIWLHIGLIYFWAGFYKLYDCGLEWALGESMINQVQLEWFEHFDTLPFWRIDRYPYLLHFGGVTVILFELLYWFFLFFPRLKYISILGGLLMHNLVGIFMYIGFPALQMQYVVFINFEKLLLWLKKLFPVISIENNIQNIKSGIGKKMVYFSFFVFGMNFLFSMFKISSFPFSVYPTYSEIIAAEKEYLHFEIADRDQHQLDVRSLGKENNFRWENFSRGDYFIIKAYHETGKIDTPGIYKQWTWWQNEIHELKTVDTIDVYIYKRILNPDAIQSIKDSVYLVRIFPNAEHK